MVDWEAGNIAIAIYTKTCGCGAHTIHERQTYRVLEVSLAPLSEHVILRITEEGHWWPHDYFRKEKPATTDIFKLAKAPVKPKVTEPTH